MTNVLTIAEIEQAINFWCAQEPVGRDGALCARARDDCWCIAAHARTIGRGTPRAGSPAPSTVSPLRPATAQTRPPYRDYLPSCKPGTLDNHGSVARAARPDRGARGPTQDAWGERRRAEDRGVAIRYGPRRPPAGVVKRPEGACIPRGASRGGWITIG